jgi:hypothetical protein
MRPQLEPMRTRVILAMLVGLSVLVGGYEAVLYCLDRDVGPHFAAIWGVVFWFLLAMWIEADSRGRKNIYRPFELGYFAFLFVVPYTPYYLVRTRRLLGILWLVAVVALFYLGYLLKWAIYAAS